MNIKMFQFIFAQNEISQSLLKLLVKKSKLSESELRAFTAEEKKIFIEKCEGKEPDVQEVYLTASNTLEKIIAEVIESK